MHSSSFPLLLATAFAGLASSNPLPYSDLFPRVDPGKILDVQPDRGGQPQDNCGNGPLTLDANTWNSRGMDDLIKNFWDSHVNSDQNFDFHQAFASQYGINLDCPHASMQCTGIPTSCSELQGNTQQKEQGWLFIQAIVAVQDLYTQVQQATNTAMDAMGSHISEYSQKFFPNNRDFVKAGRRTGVSLGSFIVGALGGIASAFYFTGPWGAAGAAIAGNVASLISTSINNDYPGIQDQKTDPLLGLTGAWSQLTQNVLAAIDNSHSAAFSNGVSNGAKSGDAILPTFMKGGAFAGYDQVIDTFSVNEPSLTNMMNDVLAAGLIGARMAEQNTFMLYIPSVKGDCQGWHGNTGKGDQYRLCNPEGMYILYNYNNNGKATTDHPPGLDSDTIAGFGGYGMSLNALMSSAAVQYQKHGLGDNARFFDYQDLVKHYKDDAGSIFSYPGLFQIPVCEIHGDSWGQSDALSTRKPPCGCKSAVDHWGTKFIDVVLDDIQGWINNGCK